MRFAAVVFGLVVLLPALARADDCTLDKNRIQAGSVCLAVQVIAKPEGPGFPLAVIVHGDGGGNIRDSYIKSFLATGERIHGAVPGSGVVFVQRPGYSSKYGKSEGYAKAEDDDYTKENVAHMAAAVVALKEAFKPSRVVWIGHSGGSAMGALAIGMNPGLFDAAVLAGCPCGDVHAWRSNRNASRGRFNASTWPNSLSPVEYQDGLKPGMEIVLLTGDKDDNTVARLAMPWVEKAKAKGVKTELILLPGLDHSGSATAPDVAEHAIRLMRQAN